MLITTPTILCKYEPEQFHKLKTVASVGEPISKYLADKWAAHVGSFWNCYGSSESTMVSAMSRHDHSQNIGHDICKGGGLSSGCPILMKRDGMTSIGRPIPNSILYVLDDRRRRQQPIGYVGSIWVGGHGISNDYIGYSRRSYAVDPFLEKK